MDSTKYEVFIRTAELGSITKAAYDLGYTQSGVTQIIRNIEKEIGLQLLNRTSKGVYLTDEGTRLLPYMREELQIQEKIRQESSLLKGVGAGRIKIGGYSVLLASCVPGICKLFHEKFPDVDIEITDGIKEELVPMLEESTVDLIFSSLEGHKNIESTHLNDGEILAFVPADHELAGYDTVTLEQLTKYPLIHFSSRSGVPNEIETFLFDNDLEWDYRITTSVSFSLFNMVREKLGLTVVSSLFVPMSDMTGLVAIPFRPPATMHFSLSYRSFKQLSPAAKEFVNCAKEYFGKR